MYITRRTGVDVNTGKTDKSLQKIPNGRWNLEEDYDGSMSKIATKNNEFNNHDHCGGDLCKYPPKTRS